MASNDGCAEGQLDLPLIDLSLLLPSDLQDLHKPCMSSPLLEMTTKIRDACQHWGFFRVINHGVESEAIQRMDSAARDLLALPTEVKDRLLPFSNYLDGYTGRSAAYPYRETVFFSRPLHSDSTQRISSHLWPQGNAEFCKVVEEYSSKVDELSQTLIKLVLMSLGFETFSRYYNSVFEKSCKGNLRMNYYSPPNNSNQSSSSIALKPHTDFSCLTLLYNDHIRGLEVQSKEGSWFRVEPLADSFSVNLGDNFQIWSNFRYRSAAHRVVYKGWSDRLSLPYFLQFGDDAELYAPEELVDHDHPRRYRAFTFKEYKDYKLQSGIIINNSYIEQFSL